MDQPSKRIVSPRQPDVKPVQPAVSQPFTHLLQYLTQRIQFAERSLVQEMSGQLLSPDTQRAFEAPSRYGKVDASWRDPNLDDELLRMRARRVESSGLFAEAHYLSQIEGELPRGVSAVEHFLMRGWVMAKDPHPAFSVRFYLSRNPDVRASGIDPLTHYIECGSSEMRDPHPLFLNFYYASQHSTLDPRDGNTWLGRFLAEKSSYISPHPIFDPEEYVRRAKIGARSASAALLHYLIEGWRQSIDASPLFKSAYYRSQIGGWAGEIEPYSHYLLHGVPRSLNPHPLFDSKRYRSIIGEFSELLDPLVHYFWKGEDAGVSPCNFLDIPFYKSKYQGEFSRRGAFWHYVTEGGRKDYLPSPYFHPVDYRAAFMNTNVANGVSPVEHFIQEGTFNLTAADLVKFLRDSTAPIPLAADVRSARDHGLSFPINVTTRLDAPEVKAFPGKIPHTDGRPNILLVAHIASDYLFGSERSFLDMIEGVAAFGANVFVALPRHVPEYTNMIRERCQRAIVFKYGWWRKNESSFDGAREVFKRIILTNDIQVVHANTIMVRECLEAARECCIPGVVHIRELITHDKDLAEIIGLSVDEIVKQVVSRSDWIIGNSKATATVFSKPGMTFVIPNTVDMNAMDIANDTVGASVRFGLISSNIPKKGILDFIEVAKRCATTVPNAEFWLIGPETSAISELKSAVSAGSLPSNIYFPGYSASPRDAISKINVVLNLSNFAESFGRTVLEAMAARRPVIAYRWGALGELVKHGQTGYLVEYKNTQDVARYVKEFSDDPERIVKFGANARREAMAGFGSESYRDAFKRAYSQILPRALLDGTRNSEPVVRHARKVDLKSKRANRVAYFCWHFPVPSETFVLSELRVLLAQGVDVIVFCKQIPHRDFKVDFPIDFYRVDSPQELARRLKETSRTIVHAHFTYPTVTEMVWPACEEAHIPFTFIAHAQDIFVHKNDAHNRLSEIGASNWCLKLFTLSRFHVDYVTKRGFPREKIAINPNAVPLTHFSLPGLGENTRRNSKRVVAIHRFVEKKGLDALVMAAPLLNNIGVQIDIYGYGPLEDALKGLVARLDTGNVKIHGQLNQEQVLEVLKDADLFACPSIRTDTGDMDGIPTSIIESMAAGVPVLTTSIAGIPELVEDGITGIVCEPTPESIAAGISRFYNLHPLQVRAIIHEARERVAERHDAVKLVDTLCRVWDNNTVDIVIVSWNNLRELRMVVDAILINTALPYHLIICDNCSQKENVGLYLDTLWSRLDNVTIVHNDKNSMVGPGTNIALAQGVSEFIIYVCGKEGVSFAKGWEQAFVRAFSAEDIGLVGSIGYSPSYFTGDQYPKGIKLFHKFRNREFAENNLEREFGHVQGGLFAIRRKMVDEIGGFSDDVPHDYTDVEYSFYAESRGWRLGEVDHVLALFNRSRPSLSQRFRDDIKVAHPVLPEQLQTFQAVIDGTLKHCNLCDWYGPDFELPDENCRSCKSSSLDRTLYRWLSDSRYLYRRLPALAVGLGGKMAQIWEEQFQGPRLTLNDLTVELEKNGRLPNAPKRLHLATLRVDACDQTRIKGVCKELRRVLASGATVLFQGELADLDIWNKLQDAFKEAMLEQGFIEKSPVRYASRALAFSFLPLRVFRRR